MESMHKIVELERIDFAAIPTIEVDAKFTQSVAQRDHERFLPILEPSV